jgi:hypothetical protein
MQGFGEKTVGIAAYFAGIPRVTEYESSLVTKSCGLLTRLDLDIGTQLRPEPF